MDPLLSIHHVKKYYESGDSVVKALDDITLNIWPGEFVAIMGQSGSGKSTLMNIVGCLDQPTDGSYLVLGEEASTLKPDELAALRRETFGFVFQRYNLLATASAEENVAIPALYAGMKKHDRLLRARELLAKLGLGERGGHRPAQLSGGQQQRVAIARALMNDPPVILADEPTGALDSRSGQDVMALLKELNDEGRTIILITHDEHVAAHAKRIIRIQDGKILSDSHPQGSEITKPISTHDSESVAGSTQTGAEAVTTAMRSLRVNLFRTLLTLLGIVIGVASVVTMMAIGNGSKQKVLTQISSMGTNLLSIQPGAPGVRSTGDNASMTMADAQSLEGINNVEFVVPQRQSTKTIRSGNTDFSSEIQGVGAAFPAARDWAVEKGVFFTDRDVQSYAPVIVLGRTVSNAFFATPDDAIGKYVLVGNIPFQVIGVMATKGAAPWGGDQDAVGFVPITTGLTRLFGSSFLSSIAVKVMSTTIIDQTQDAITEILKNRHQKEDFNVRNTASFLEMATATQNTLTVLLGSVAAISLLVGGIGVMNIMLVSVTERTREIGIRMAAGARQKDIMVQFNTEAAVVCTIGGILGVFLGILAGLAISFFNVEVIFSPWPSMLAFTSAVLTGLLFGYLPARKAAQLDPVIALSSE